METAKREMTFLLAEPERRVLRAMAARLPLSIRSNHLTALGVAAALGTGVGYALSGFNAAWLWLASAMLVVNWFGDSMDGTVARVRKAERPKYGYYIDHVVDAFNAAVIGIGIGLSPFVRLDLALILIVVFLTLSINVYLESSVFGVFKIAYARIGTTEARIILILANTLLFFGATTFGWLERWVSFAANVVVGLSALGMFVVLLVRLPQVIVTL